MSTHSTKPHISVAPMMDWTDRHCRYFHRLISPNAVLYTEMVTTGAILHGDRDRFLRFSEQEHPVVLQLGGSSPEELATCAQLAQEYGYDEVNLNCGCPSDRVQSGRFGAILMESPDLVARCVESMEKAVDIPVSIKCRIGIDEQDSFEFLEDFVRRTSEAGCQSYTIHARKAWLQGLSPKENREIPALNYARVQAIKEAFPHLIFYLNGGIQNIDFIVNNLKNARSPKASSCGSTAGSIAPKEKDPAITSRDDDWGGYDGMMIGREAYQNPYFLADIEEQIFSNTALKSREEVALAMIPYAEEQYKSYGTPIKSIPRHMMGLFQGLPGARQWRRYLSENAHTEASDARVIEKALEAMSARKAA